MIRWNSESEMINLWLQVEELEEHYALQQQLREGTNKTRGWLVLMGLSQQTCTKHLTNIYNNPKYLANGWHINIFLLQTFVKNFNKV